jgi:beta-galactosidase
VLHIFPHWNLQGHEGEQIELWAYSNCDEVELTVNGKKLGRQAMPKNGHLKWNATYQPGKVVAVGYKDGKRIITQTIETTKPAYRIMLKADRLTIAADSRDLSVVTVEVQDQKGRIVPDACPMLQFQLAGDGRILGAGNGDPMYLGADHPKERNCHRFSIPAFNGLAQIIIQASDVPSSLSLSCQSEGLKSGSIQIITQ